jgi:outer membrane biogenesis lipoprotein LolB
MKLLHVSLLALIILTGCTTKKFTVNGLICPDNHTEQMVQHDLSECHYYDQKAIEESATPQLDDECKRCLIERGYEIE